MSEPGDLRSAVARKGSFVQTMKAIGWAFFGVRRAKDYERDVVQLNPVHVIIAGVIGALLFITILILIVRFVVSSGVAT